MGAPRVRCPTCRRELTWSAEFPYRPFCSERCRMVDLGAWVTGERGIAGEPADDATLAAALRERGREH